MIVRDYQKRIEIVSFFHKLKKISEAQETF